MLTIPLTFSLAPFPTGQALNADQFGQQLVANLQASFSANLLQGQTGGTMPSANIGPWFDGSIWWAWNPGLSVYAPVLAGNGSSNVVRNSNMQVAQRGTAFTSVTTGLYTLDGYKVSKNLTTGVADVNRVSAPILSTANYPSGQFTTSATVTTLQLTIGAGEYFFISQGIERQFARDLFGNPSSLSIYLQSNLPGVYCVSLRNADNTWSYVQECSILAADIPQWFALQNIPAMPTATGNWGTLETDLCYGISVCATSGANFQTATPGVWVNTNALCTANQANLFATGSNYLMMTFLKHESGIISTPLQPVRFDDDLRACQRYYSQSYSYGTVPGTVTGTNELFYNCAANTFANGASRFPVPMRISPSVTIYNSVTGAINFAEGYPSGFDVAISGTHAGDSILSYIAGGSIVTGNMYRFHYTASADI